VSLANFIRAAIAGVIATAVMAMTGWWQRGIGLGQVDVGEALSRNMGHHFVWGQGTFLAAGVILALVYAQWVFPRLPGTAVTKGLLYGAAFAAVAVVVAAPVIGAGSAEPFGFFYSKMANPAAMIGGSVLACVAYGLALGLSYQPGPEPTRA
jgi:hypothetical protein